jgi:pullulanase
LTIAIRHGCRPAPGRCALILVVALGLAGSAFAAPAQTRADCDGVAWQTVLQASPAARFGAEAVWLTGHSLRWPKVDASGRFRLVHSAGGQIVAAVGSQVTGGDGAIPLTVFDSPLPPAAAARFKYVADGVVLTVPAADTARLPTLHQEQLVLVQEDANGSVRRASAVQSAGALDALYAPAEAVTDFGATPSPGSTAFRLWAPTAQAVSVCSYRSGSGAAQALIPMGRDATTGVWSATLAGDRSGSYYTYLVDVFVRGVGLVRNRVTDPYSISLTTDSTRSYVADLGSRALEPPGWDRVPAPATVSVPTDMVVYELHVRDFSITDASVPSAHRGKYLAFTDTRSNGMRHLRALARAGLTDVHLLPVFDFATVPEAGCVTPTVRGGPASERQQTAAVANAARDCYNWGYDPFHYGAPEGSYASSAADGATRVIEFRRMVMALHRAGLRVGMDVVYNHTAAAGQNPHSVLDRIVPGYYQRLDANGAVERSTCCDNTATENRMMGKLMIDSVLRWATQYRIDSFRFDLMGHQPRAVMQALKARVEAATGRVVPLIGEGWNFGEVANGARFVQASQLALNGSGIATFSDRARDAVRGGSASDRGAALIRRQGYINGLVYDPNALADPHVPVSELMRTADLVRVGLAGSIRSYSFATYSGARKLLQDIDYNGQPAGYASEPDEVVNYVENHDNQTLFDLDVYKLPPATRREDRARVQMLGAAIVAFSQGVAYFHAGMDTLRSKSMDRNSYDSGDWFNRIDWTYRTNHFGSGLPPQRDNGPEWALLRPLLADPRIAPRPENIAWARDEFRDLLKIRASSTLFRLRSAAEIRQRLRFANTGPTQQPQVLVGHLDGAGLAGAGFRELLYFINVDKTAHTLALDDEKGKAYVLHPVHLNPAAADQRPAAQAHYEPATGRFTVPPRSAVVYVLN